MFLNMGLPTRCWDEKKTGLLGTKFGNGYFEAKNIFHCRSFAATVNMEETQPALGALRACPA